MLDYEIGTATLVHLATFAYVLGFLFRNQIILRLLILSGSTFYISYYYFHNGVPQWDAIIGSVLIASATLYGLLNLVYSLIPIGISEDRKQIFEALQPLEPGEFRRLIAIATLRIRDEPVVLAREGDVPDKLFFVLSGRPVVEKDDSAFRIWNNTFVGEIAMLLDTPASATVRLPEGGTFVEWDVRELRRLLARASKLRQAFEALIGRDMAEKVARSAPVRGELLLRAQAV